MLIWVDRKTMSDDLMRLSGNNPHADLGDQGGTKACRPLSSEAETGWGAPSDAPLRTQPELRAGTPS